MVHLYRMEHDMRTFPNPDIPIQIEGWPGVYRQESFLGAAQFSAPAPDPIDSINDLIESAYPAPAGQPNAV